MPITIQELIPSDTISQAVNKINFNFDQLLLNGGGPVGPAGPIGPTGPVGGRGLRGATWYNDPAVAPGTDPNTIIIATVEEDDYYLQANGDVWEYNGTVWVLTPVNLTGPQGSSGSSFGFNYAGGYPGSGSINNQNVAYIAPMPGGTSSGAVQGTNEAVSVAVFGGIATTAVAPSGISFTNAFLIPDVMTKSLDASVLSVLVHQKDSASAAIKFMGGGAIPGENYEQTVFGNLSDISLGIDDALNINIPKAATSPLSVSDLIGFNVNTLKRGQQYYAGKHINFISGVDNTSSGLGSEISDITFTVGTSNPSIPAKFAVSTTLGSASALFEIGGNITIPTAVTTKTGTSLIEANNIVNWGNSVLMASASNNRIRVDATGILLNSSIAPITISTTGQAIDVSAGTVLNLLGTTINITSATTGTVNIGTGGANLIELEQSTATHSIRLDNTNVLSGGTKIKGNLTWGVSSYATPYTTTRHIAIIADGLAKNKPPIFVIRNDASASPAGDSMASFSKNSVGSAIEVVNISTASVTTANYSGNAGFAGFKAINSHPAGLADFGVKVEAYDTVSGVYGTKFHASENTTAVSNRFQYVRKYLKIDPMTQGLTSGTGYTIPSTYMDASFLDVHVGSFSGTGGVAATYHNQFPLIIPDGLYPGQRLQLHVVVQPGRHYDGGVQYNWPNALPSSGECIIRINDFANGATEDIATVVASAWNGSPLQAGELFAELLWIGQSYITQWQTSSTLTNKTSERGWVITNVARVNYPGPYAFEDTATTTLNVT